MQEYHVERDDVMLLHERVGEAQHGAIVKMKELHGNRGGKRGANKGKNVWGVKSGRIEKNRDAMDQEEEQG